MNIVPRKIESHNTWQICKLGIHGLKKLLLTISMNLSQRKIQVMISHQHQNVAGDMDGVDEVAEEEVEEEHINIKQTSHSEKSDLKLYCHTLYHQINLKLSLPDNRLKMCHNALYQPINLKLKFKHNPQHHIPPVFPISDNASLAVGQSGQRTNAQLLYGPLVPQTDEDRLLCGMQPTIVMYNRMIRNVTHVM